jgi:uroporphyrinogen-III decarboxylase
VEAGADFISEYWWKDWSEYEAVRFMLQSGKYVFDAAEFHRWGERLGDDGVMMVYLTQSPLKTFHWLAGPENGTLFAVDHPEEMKALAAIQEEKALAVLESAVDNPEAQLFISLDNLDSAFFPPRLYRDYCDSFFSRAAEIVHSRGKIFLVHACGRSRVLLPLVGNSRVDCLEGLTPPPMGNVELGEARRLAGYHNYTVNGGMDASRLEIAEVAEPHIHDYTRRLFDSMGDKRHFIFASSCATSAPTPWRNLVHFRDAARQYGRVD